MTGMRKGDSKPYTKLRPGRFFKEAGRWYFQTREGSTEGPFEHRVAAEDGLDTYLMIFKDLQLQSVSSGFYSSAANMALEPIQMQWR